MYITKVDPTSSLGLSTDSIYSYSMGHIKRVLGGDVPETQPSRCMSRGPGAITVTLKGPSVQLIHSQSFVNGTLIADSTAFMKVKCVVFEWRPSDSVCHSDLTV